HGDGDQTAGAGASHDRLVQRSREHRGKERDDVDLHSSSSPAGGSITIRRSATLTSTTIAGTAGIRISRPSCRTTHRSWAPALSTPTNAPTGCPSRVPTRPPSSRQG